MDSLDSTPNRVAVSLFLAVLLFGLPMMAMAQNPSVSLIPKPMKMELGQGAFTVGPDTRILVEKTCPGLDGIARHFAQRLRQATGYSLAVQSADGKATSGSTILLTTAEAGPTLGEEGYEIAASPEQVVVRGARPAGVFYGVQTLRWLLPAEIESGKRVVGVAWTVPAAHIEDRPRFAWRGMHLDVARHFFPKEFVKRYIDYLACCKINIFHLYLTDDQGWRIEIKRYPKLTEIGAWRKGTRMHTRGGQPDARRYGGFYTQDDIREIVQYAAERFITVVPGISMPGHSQAALAAYPKLSSTGGPFEVWTGWGISKEVMDPGKEEVFTFVENVLEEVIGLFPSPYIHTGGDEVPRDRWKASPFAQARMKQEGLADEDQLQAYFTRRIEQFLRSRGRRLVGWDEIIQGGLAPGAIVMSWRGTAGGVTAAAAGHQVVMTPNRQTYFNYAQDSSRQGPGHTGQSLPLQAVYQFDPTTGLSAAQAKFVLGAQACLWTEYVPAPADVEYLLFPRLFAMAEVLWSSKAQRDYDDFCRRLPHGLKRLESAGVRYHEKDSTIKAVGPP